MSETELLRAFFQAYEAVQALPKQKGPPGPEKRAAMEHLEQTAAAVRVFSAPKAPGADEYRLLQHQVASIAPKDTRKAARGT